MSGLMRRLRGDQAGVTLVEAVVTMVLVSTVGLVVSKAVMDSNKLTRITNDQSEGLADIRIAAERLNRDLRDARSVLCNPSGTPAGLTSDAACAYHLQLWIDTNSDYVQQANETVTWNLRSSSGGHYDLLRTVSGATEVVEARTVVRNVAFSYDLAPGATTPAPGAPHTTTVNVDMFYDARTKTGTTTKTVSLSARLRNVT